MKDPKQAAAAMMTPEERALWLASKNAPPGAMLVYEVEMDKIRKGLADQQLVLSIHNSGSELLKSALGEYFEQEPGLVDATKSAVSDARRYKKAVDLSIPKLRAAEIKLEAARTFLVERAGFAVNKDLLDAADLIREVVKLAAAAKLPRAEAPKGKS